MFRAKRTAVSYTLPLEELGHLSLGNLLPRNGFVFHAVPRVLFIDTPGNHLAIYDPFKAQLVNLEPFFSLPPHDTQSQDVYRCLALGGQTLASCRINKSIRQTGSNTNPPPIEVLDITTGQLSAIARSNVRSDDGTSYGFYEVVALSLAHDNKKLAVLEHFQWMPWVESPLRKPIPPRLVLFEAGVEGWKPVAQRAMPWQANRFLAAFDDTLFLAGRHDIYALSSADLADKAPAVDLDTFNPAFKHSETLAIEAISLDNTWIVLSNKKPHAPRAQYSYVAMGRKLMHFPSDLEPVSNILFVNFDTVVYLSRRSKKLFFELVFLSLRQNSWESWPLREVGFSPPEVFHHVWPPKGKLLFLGKSRLGLLWCRAPVSCLRFFSIPIQWTLTGQKPEPLTLHVWDL